MCHTRFLRLDLDYVIAETVDLERLPREQDHGGILLFDDAWPFHGHAVGQAAAIVGIGIDEPARAPEVDLALTLQRAGGRFGTARQLWSLEGAGFARAGHAPMEEIDR